MCSTVSSALLSIYGVCDLLCLHLHIQLLDYHWQMRKKCVFLANRDTSSHTHLIHGAISNGYYPSIYGLFSSKLYFSWLANACINQFSLIHLHFAHLVKFELWSFLDGLNHFFPLSKVQWKITASFSLQPPPSAPPEPCHCHPLPIPAPEKRKDTILNQESWWKRCCTSACPQPR